MIWEEGVSADIQEISTEFQRDMVSLLPRLRRFAWGLCGNRDGADDLVQAACERAMTRVHQWQHGTRLDSWLFQIIRTLYIDGLRSEAVRVRHLETVASSDIHPHEEAGPEVQMHLEQARRAIARLPEDQRSAFLLVAVEGYSYREAAEIIGVPMGTMASRVTRARDALLSVLRDARPLDAGGGTVAVESEGI